MAQSINQNDLYSASMFKGALTKNLIQRNQVELIVLVLLVLNVGSALVLLNVIQTLCICQNDIAKFGPRVSNLGWSAPSMFRPPVVVWVATLDIQVLTARADIATKQPLHNQQWHFKSDFLLFLTHTFVLSNGNQNFWLDAYSSFRWYKRFWEYILLRSSVVM